MKYAVKVEVVSITCNDTEDVFGDDEIYLQVDLICVLSCTAGVFA
jgi:hypothetical protein